MADKFTKVVNFASSKAGKKYQADKPSARAIPSPKLAKLFFPILLKTTKPNSGANMVTVAGWAIIQPDKAKPNHNPLLKSGLANNRSKVEKAIGINK